MTREERTAASRASVVLDDRAFAAWSHISLEPTGERNPFAVKDVIDVAGMPTSCGFEPWRDRIATEDATVVARLRAAGWDPIGKTHTAQFAFSDPPPTLNPFDPTRTPGGSSTGSAVAVSRGHVGMALATQTGGSTIRPAAYCGVVGMKPTYGVVPMDGIHPVAPSLDTIGIIADSVATTAETARDLAIIERSDLARPGEAAIPVVASFGDVRPLLETDAAVESWRLVMAAIATSIGTHDRPIPQLDLDRTVEQHVRLMALEAWPFHATTFAGAEGAFYGPKLRRLLALGRDLTGTAEPQEILRNLRHGLAGLAAAVPEDGVLLMPATVSGPPVRTETGSSRLCMPWTVLGAPVVVVPWEVRLPDGSIERGGVQVVGPRGADAAALLVAEIVERSLRAAGHGVAGIA